MRVRSPSNSPFKMSPKTHPEDQASVLYSSGEVAPTISSTHPSENLGGETAKPPIRLFTYDSGYGDFCFLRLVDSYPKPPKGIIDHFERFVILYSFIEFQWLILK